MKNILFADSGGTRTDWVWCDQDGKKSFFESESYHPQNWSDDFWSRLDDYWKAKPELLNCEVRLYCAGCYNELNALILKEKLVDIGFQNVLVSSDLHAAGLASFKSGKGTVAILGTGSVMFNFENGIVTNLIGGKGHLIGDEGSGFFFGKLVLEKYESKSLNKDQIYALESVCTPSLLLNCADYKSKIEWSKLAALLFSEKELFEAIHLENIDAFIAAHFTAFTPVEISIVGSYGYYYQDFWTLKFNSVGCELQSAISRPIEHLVD